MSLKYLGVAALSVLIFASANAYANDITIQRAVPFAKRANTSPSVRGRCKLQTKLPIFIQRYSKKQGIKVNFTDENVRTMRGRVMIITITQTGYRSVSISGRLKERGRTVARFTAGRFTTGGYYGGWKGTCSLLGRCVKRLGKDVAVWLKDPQDGAFLGDVTVHQRPGYRY